VGKIDDAVCHAYPVINDLQLSSFCF
jgi:hypothetical protein